MRVLIQRVSKASVTIHGEAKSKIDKGLLVLVGIEDQDRGEDIDWLTKKIANLRIFDDPDGVMNLSLIDIQGDVLVVSQFTLHGSTKKGNRPSYIKAAKPEVSVPLYNEFCKVMQALVAKEVKTGEFGADMQVELINDGPVTIWIDSKNRE